MVAWQPAGMGDVVDVEIRFYHASTHLDRGLEGQHDGMYCEHYDIRYRKVKKDAEIPRMHETAIR